MKKDRIEGKKNDMLLILFIIILGSVFIVSFVFLTNAVFSIHQTTFIHVVSIRCYERNNLSQCMKTYKITTTIWGN